jgi:rhamnosyltransferase
MNLVHAVVVTFEPEPSTLKRLLESIQAQVGCVLVVDNGSALKPSLQALAGADLLALPRNVGLAAAQNAGIALAREQGARFILLLDQDSVPDPSMVAELLTVYRQGLAQQLRIAAVGPAALEASGLCEGFVRHRSGRYVAVLEPDAGRPWVTCDFLIASGSLIPVAVLDELGPMDERLFIDKIDTEWSLRAAAAGYVLLGAPRAHLHHQLGERRVRLWFGQWRELSQHKAFRYYYMVRNSLLLRRLPHASSSWRQADARQLRSIVLYFGILAPGRGPALWMMLRGAFDGLRGRFGRLR